MEQKKLPFSQWVSIDIGLALSDTPNRFRITMQEGGDMVTRDEKGVEVERVKIAPRENTPTIVRPMDVFKYEAK